MFYKSSNRRNRVQSKFYYNISFNLATLQQFFKKRQNRRYDHFNVIKNCIKNSTISRIVNFFRNKNNDFTNELNVYLAENQMNPDKLLIISDAMLTKHSDPEVCK